MNLAAFAVAGFEYFFGIGQLFPRNQVTELIYRSKDVLGHTAYRIPGSFANAHAFGGTMVVSLPLLVGAFTQKHKRPLHGQILILGIVTALVGLLMSGARTHFVMAGILVLVATFSLRSSIGYAVGWLVLLVGIGWLVSGEQRLQRFMELRDTEMIAERVSSSVNMTFFEIAARYPFGNGLGGGGTSIPYFLQDRIIAPLGLENEYARIVSEQGLFGLFIWVLFIVWLMRRRNPRHDDSWHLGWRLAWVACIVLFLTGLTGTGLLTSIPQSALFLILVGWVGAQPVIRESELTAGAGSLVVQPTPEKIDAVRA